MAIVVSQAIAKIDADDSGLKKGFEGIKAKFSEGEGWASHFGGALTGALTGTAIIGALGGVVGALGDMVKEGAGANEVAAQTDAALKSTHGAAGMTAQAIDALSNKYMNLTGIDDDVIHGAENIMLSFQNVKKDAFEPATRAALDLATRLGMDVPSAAAIVGRALDNPAQAARSLRAAHIDLTKQEQDSIKTMMAHGDAAGAQAIILQELNKRYGGAAEAAGETNGGIKILTAQFNNMKQGVGQAILEALVPLAQAALPKVRDALGAVNGIVQNATKFMREHKDIVGTVAVVVGGILTAAFVAWGISVIAATWPILAIGAAVGLLIVGLKAAYDHVGWFHDAVDHIKPTLQLMGQVIKEDVQHVGDFIAKIGDLLGWLGRVKDAIGNAFKGLGNIQLPHFASGGMMPAPGMAMVGEQGPELVYLPGGSRVVNAADTAAMMSGSSSVTAGRPGSFSSAASTQPVHIHVHVAGRHVADALLPDIVKAARTATGAKI